jgi:hypoxanthine phosphoribosyltransferase
MQDSSFEAWVANNLYPVSCISTQYLASTLSSLVVTVSSHGHLYEKIKLYFLIMPELIPILKKDDIDKIVSAVARKISSDYKDRELVLIGVLKGAFIFLADLVRHLTIPVKIDFVRTSSYGADTSSSGNIHLTKEIEIDVKGKDVLVIEDIVDTGLTLTYLIDYLKSFGPNTVKVCTLLDKQERRKTKIKADYVCHVVEKGFLVGYGLDYAEEYRNLPEIYDMIL